MGLSVCVLSVSMDWIGCTILKGRGAETDEGGREGVLRDT